MSSQEYKNEVFWVADDGSYGYGWVATFTKANWSDDQHDWLNRYLNEGSDPTIEAIESIDDGIEPAWEDN